MISTPYSSIVLLSPLLDRSEFDRALFEEVDTIGVIMKSDPVFKKFFNIVFSVIEHNLTFFCDSLCVQLVIASTATKINIFIEILFDFFIFLKV